MRDVEAPLEVGLEFGFPIGIAEINGRVVALDPGEDAAALRCGYGRQGARSGEATAVGDAREGEFGSDRLRQSRHGTEITRQQRRIRKKKKGRM